MVSLFVPFALRLEV